MLPISQSIGYAGVASATSNLLIGGSATAAAAAHEDWRILAVGAVVTLGTTFLQLLAAHLRMRASAKPSRRTSRRKTNQNKSPDNGAK